MKRVLVLSPHPDDEAIGCGGTICRHIADGDVVGVVFLTSGEKGGHGRSPAETLRVREKEARQAAQFLGLNQLEFWHEPDGRFRSTAAVVARLQAKLKKFRPDVIYVTHHRETHPDHRASVRLVQRALERSRARPEVLMFEVWTPIQRIDEVVDISIFMPRKLAAVRAYRSQCAVVDFAAAVRSLNRYRGELHSWPGGDYAEIFERLWP